MRCTPGGGTGWAAHYFAAKGISNPSEREERSFDAAPTGSGSIAVAEKTT